MMLILQRTAAKTLMPGAKGSHITLRHNVTGEVITLALIDVKSQTEASIGINADRGWDIERDDCGQKPAKTKKRG